MRTLQLTFGAFVEIAASKDISRGHVRPVVMARGRAFDAQCQGTTEADALTGLAEYYEAVARELHNAARDAARSPEVHS